MLFPQLTITIPHRTIAPMKNRLAIAMVIAAAVIGLSVAALLAFFIVRKSAQPKVTSTATVVMQIQSLSELVTVKYVLEKIVPAEAAKTDTIDNLPGISSLRSDKIILLAHGVVKAGVDLGKLTNSDVTVSGEKITLTIPGARVTDAYLDERNTQVVDRQTGLLKSFDRTLEQTARQYALLEIQRAARQNGIEREANERAREQLSRLLKSLGYKEVEIRSR
jgi:hypothetical protein